VKLPESVQLVYDWGRWNGYGDTTHAEAREVLQAFRRRYSGKPVAYLRTVASVDGGGFDDFYREVRDRRSDEVRDAIKALIASEPECGHGTAAGKAPHPTTGLPLCPLCRAGWGVTVDSGPTTTPIVGAAVDAYRAAYRTAAAEEPKTPWLLRITHQSAALAHRGLSIEMLAAIAARAGKERIDLFAAVNATEGTPA
jgi:hypothetical protein